MNLEIADRILLCETYRKKLTELLQEDDDTISYSIQKDLLNLYQNQIQEEETLLKEILNNIRSIQK